MAEKRAIYEREVERLRGSIEALDRDVKGSKHVLWFGLLAIPAGIFVGQVAAVVVILFTVSLLATALYLIGVRKREYHGLIVDCQRDLERAEAAAAARPSLRA
jgi:hypothetical protein